MELDMTNQSTEDIETTATQTEDDGSDWFKDIEDTPDQSDENQETKAETDSETTEQNEETTSSEDTPILTIKYNGADVQLTQAEAIEFAQKGKNYDKVYSELQTLKSAPEAALLKSLADDAGLDTIGFLNHLQKFNADAKINQIAQTYKQQYPDASDDLLMTLAKTQYEKETSNQKQQHEAAQVNQAQLERNRMIEQLNAFDKKYPGVGVENLPQIVIERMNEGSSLIDAYTAYELENVRKEKEELEKKLEAEKVNKTNKNKTPGSLESNTKEIAADPFFAGFNS